MWRAWCEDCNISWYPRSFGLDPGLAVGRAGSGVGDVMTGCPLCCASQMWGAFWCMIELRGGASVTTQTGTAYRISTRQITHFTAVPGVEYTSTAVYGGSARFSHISIHTWTCWSIIMGITDKLKNRKLGLEHRPSCITARPRYRLRPSSDGPGRRAPRRALYKTSVRTTTRAPAHYKPASPLT